MAFGDTELKPNEKVELLSRFYVLHHNGANEIAVFQHGMPDNLGYDEFKHIPTRMSDGSMSFPSAIESTGFFSQFDIAALRIGYEGGNFDSVLKDLANHYATIVSLGL